jgi:hypothetical protein
VATDFNLSARRGLAAVLELAEDLDVQLDFVYVLRLPVPLPALLGEVPKLGLHVQWLLKRGG